MSNVLIQSLDWATSAPFERGNIPFFAWCLNEPNSSCANTFVFFVLSLLGKQRFESEFFEMRRTYG